MTENFLIYKLFSSWGPKHFHTRTRNLDIAIFVGIPYCRVYKNRHTHIYL